MVKCGVPVMSETEVDRERKGGREGGREGRRDGRTDGRTDGQGRTN